MSSFNMIVCVVCATLMLPAVVNSATIDDNEMGMGILYDMTNIFLGDVIHTKKISNSFLNLSAVFESGKFHEDQVNDWRKWLEYLIGFSVCAAIGIVFIVVMPIVGLIFCCCRLSGRCGARPGKKTFKRANCKRRTYCTVLTILTTIALAGIVCAFLCNSLVYKHLQNDNNEGTIGNVKDSLEQVESFINTAVNGYADYALDVYKNTTQNVLKQVNDSATGAGERVLEQLHAVALLADASEISKEVNETKVELDSISELLGNLSNESTQLRDNLTDIKQDIDNVCTPQECQGYDSSKYDTNVDFSSLDKLSDQSKNVAAAMGMQKYIDEAKESLEQAKQDAYNNIRNQVDGAADAIKDVENVINSRINDLKNEKKKLLDNFPDIYEKMDDGNDEVRKYSNYTFYAGIGVCCVYLLVVILYYIGILFGICGERPGDGAPCCNTGCGANFLISGVAFTFIFSWILMIICVVLFCVGGPVYTEVCRYFIDHDPAQFKVFDDLIQNAIDAKSYYNTPPPDFSIAKTIQNCQENRPLFSSLQLDYVIDLNKTLDISSIEEKIEDLLNANFDIDNITIISSDLTDSLNDMINSGLDNINFTQYFTELSKKLTVGDLSQMASILTGIADHTTNDTIKSVLRDSATRLQNLDSNTLPYIKDNENQLNVTLIALQQKLKLKSAIQILMANLTAAENNFNTNKKKLIASELAKFIGNIINEISTSVNSIKYQLRNNLYGCQNLSTALFTISDAVCVQAIEPMNGLWFSFGWCLFFFVPCLIFAVLLAGQYRRSLDDDKEFDDPNYIMYGGPNPDTIPLTSGNKSSRAHVNNTFTNDYGHV